MIDGYEKCDEQLFGDCRLVMSQQMLGGRGARELRCFVICLFVLRASHGARPSSTLDRVVTKWCKCGSGNPADERNSYAEELVYAAFWIALRLLYIRPTEHGHHRTLIDVCCAL